MTNSPSASRGRFVIWAVVVALFILHQDFWLWDNRTLVFGFLPVGLFYHALFSLAAGITWFLANRFAWPAEIEAWAEGGETPEPSPSPESGKGGRP